MGEDKMGQKGIGEDRIEYDTTGQVQHIIRG